MKTTRSGALLLLGQVTLPAANIVLELVRRHHVRRCTVAQVPESAGVIGAGAGGLNDGADPEGLLTGG